MYDSSEVTSQLYMCSAKRKVVENTSDYDSAIEYVCKTDEHELVKFDWVVKSLSLNKRYRKSKHCIWCKFTRGGVF